ncbi:MAG: hypothetical protein HY075_14300 [Deltaproteobacteria bacterium]|nr:hypothetical protein [Deltaproteobacteria bacterium]
MLLSKKLNSFALTLLAVSPFVMNAIECRAADAPAAPAPVVVADDAGHGYESSVKDGDVSRIIKGFKIKKVSNDAGTHFQVIGLGRPECLRHIHIQIDRPVDLDSGMFTTTIKKFDLKGDAGAVAKFEDDCKLENTLKCSRDKDASGCVEIGDGDVGAKIGAKFIEGEYLNENGKVSYCYEKDGTSKADDESVTCGPLPKAFGGPLEFNTPATIKAQMDAKREKERNELIASTCKSAEKGNRDDFESLKDMLGPNAVAKNEKFFTKLEAKVNQKELDEIAKGIDNADTIGKMNDVIDRLEQFAKDHEEMKADVVKLLVDGVAKKALDLESEKSGDNFEAAKLKLAERALKVAKNLDRTDKKLRALYEKAHHEVSKARTKDQMFNEGARNDAMNGFDKVVSWAAASKSAEARDVVGEYLQDMPAQARQQAQMILNQRQLSSGDRRYLKDLYGASLDVNAQNQSMEDAFRQYQQNARMNPYGGYNGGAGKF